MRTATLVVLGCVACTSNDNPSKLWLFSRDEMTATLVDQEPVTY